MYLKEVVAVMAITSFLAGGIWGIDNTYARQTTVSSIVNEITGLRLDALYARLSQLQQISEQRELTQFEKAELERIKRNIVRLNGRI